MGDVSGPDGAEPPGRLEATRPLRSEPGAVHVGRTRTGRTEQLAVGRSSWYMTERLGGTEQSIKDGACLVGQLSTCGSKLFASQRQERRICSVLNLQKCHPTSRNHQHENSYFTKRPCNKHGTKSNCLHEFCRTRTIDIFFLVEGVFSEAVDCFR